MQSHLMPFTGDALKGRRILVTGGSSGIGTATARRLASMGASVVIQGRDAERLQAVCEQLPGQGHQSLSADFESDSSWEAVDHVIASHSDWFGLVHCAGSQIAKPIRVARASDYRRMFDVHVIAAQELMRRISGRIGRNGRGSFVLIGSVSGVRGGAGVGPYATVKAAVSALSRVAAIELAPLSIRVNCLVPGMVPTPMSDQLMAKLPRDRREQVVEEHLLGLGRTVDVADAVGFLMTDASQWMTGTTLPIDGGFLCR